MLRPALFPPLAGLALLLAALGPARACTGDCDRNGVVGVDEAMRGIAVALGQLPLEGCPSADRDGDGAVTVDELLDAIHALLQGCPTATATATATPTTTPSATPTPTPNQPPLPRPASIYRTYAGFDVRVPLATDPEGGPLQCTAESLPEGASIEAGELRWRPGAAQLGPRTVPFTCADAAEPPASADGAVTFKVLPLDPCSLPTCDPASGCTLALPPPDQLCCPAEPIARVAEPAADCPAGRVAFIGRNASGFGRLQNCDTMQVRVFAQSGATITFHVEARCLNIFNRVEVFARIETRRRVLVNSVQALFITPEPDGFARARNLTFTVLGGGPFFDIEEDDEANVYVRLTDADGVSAETRLRVRLRFARQPDLPEADVTPAAPLTE